MWRHGRYTVLTSRSGACDDAARRATGTETDAHAEEHIQWEASLRAKRGIGMRQCDDASRNANECAMQPAISILV